MQAFSDVTVAAPQPCRCGSRNNAALVHGTGVGSTVDAYTHDRTRHTARIPSSKTAILPVDSPDRSPSFSAIVAVTYRTLPRCLRTLLLPVAACMVTFTIPFVHYSHSFPYHLPTLPAIPHCPFYTALHLLPLPFYQLPHLAHPVHILHCTHCLLHTFAHTLPLPLPLRTTFTSADIQHHHTFPMPHILCLVTACPCCTCLTLPLHTHTHPTHHTLHTYITFATMLTVTFIAVYLLPFTFPHFLVLHQYSPHFPPQAKTA